MNDLLHRLIGQLDERSAAVATLNAYYAGTQPLAYLSPEARDALGTRFTVMSTNVCRLAVTSLAERLRITGFKGSNGPSMKAWAAWRHCDMDQASVMAHREALALGKSYVSVWADPDGRCRISVESAQQVTHLADPATREITAAVKKWSTRDATFAVLHEPDQITKFRARQSGAVTGFTAVETLDNPLGEVVITPLINSDRLLDQHGISEMADLLPLVDALNKTLSDMLVGSEYYARPRRWATGVELDEDDDGNPVNPYAEGIKMMISEDPNTKFGSLPAADLASYEAAVRVLTSQIMAVSALPAHYLGTLTNQPTSADALRAAEASLTARAEARQATFGRAWERVARHALAVETGADPTTIDVGVQWADPATRSIAQEADAIVKLYSAGLLPATYALARLGYTDDEISTIRTAARTEALDKAGTDLAGLLP